MSELDRLLDTELPEPRLKPSFREYSSTHVPWITGFDRHVVFHEWQSFEKEILLMNTTVALKLRAKNVRMAASFLSSAREAVLGEKVNVDATSSEEEIRAAPVYSDSTSMQTVHCNVFAALERVIQHLSSSPELVLKTKQLWLGRPDKTPKGVNGNTHRFPGQGKTADRTPDFTLMRLASTGDTVGRPICAFEIKGPCLDILGKPTSSRKAKAKSEHDPAVAAIVGEKVSAKVLCDRYNYYFEADLLEDDEQQIQTAGQSVAYHPTAGESDDAQTVAGPAPDSHASEGQAAEVQSAAGEATPVQSTAGEAVESAAGAATTATIRTSPSEGIPSNSARKPIAQAVTYALSVTSGCAFLYNYHVGVALEIQQNTEDKEVLHVNVSKPFYRDGIIGPLDAMVALSLHSLTRDSTEHKLPLYIRSMANMIQSKSRVRDDDWLEQKDNTESNSGRGTKRGASRAQSQEKRRKASTGEGANDHGDSGGVISYSSELLGTYQQFGDKAYSSSSYGTATLTIASDQDDEDKCNELFRAIGSTFEMNSMSLLQARKLSREKVLALGKSGIVYETTWRNTKLAVKEWNGHCMEGFHDMIRELSMLCRIKKRFSSLLGVVIPRVLFVFAPADRDELIRQAPMLISELVGEEIHRDEQGMLFVGKDLIHDKDERAIGKSALQGLSALHSHGIVHGDIDLRNLRVEKGGLGTAGERAWKVWWIDFGLACDVGPGHPSCEGEKRTCRDMFRILD